MKDNPMNENNLIKKDLLSQLLYEAEAYRKFEDIEKLVEAGLDLSVLPVQPLYVALQNTSSDQIAQILPKLSTEQRQALRDIDLWNKDEVDPKAAMHWLEIYSKCPSDDVKFEYARSEDFLLSVKNQITIQTFDVEDPLYPDSDNYFLTEDNLLLIEYPEDFTLVQELKEMVKLLYSGMGVEYAYSFLFKMVVDSYQIMEENSYEEKVERLRDFGFVEHFQALEYNAPFFQMEQLDHFINTKKAATGALDSLSSFQSLHASSLTSYQAGMDKIKEALSRIQDEKRQQYLHFNFIRLVNAQMTLHGALKGGSVAMAKVGNRTRQNLELGFDYVLSKLTKEEGEQVFARFDFLDLFKVGQSLIEISKKKVKTALAKTPFDSHDLSYFLGTYWNSLLDNSTEETARFKFDGSSKATEINNLEIYHLWNSSLETLVSAFPFVQMFFKSLEKLRAENLLHDEFYLNYEVDNIDFEAIMISSFINFTGEHYQESSAGKMGVTLQELKDFYHQFFNKNGEEYLIKGEESPILREKLSLFVEKFGFSQIPSFDKYLYQILLEQMNGYEIDSMESEEFRHVGGPILLNSK